MAIPNVGTRAIDVCVKAYHGECPGGAGEKYNPDGSLNALRWPCAECNWRSTPYGKQLLSKESSGVRDPAAEQTASGQEVALSLGEINAAYRKLNDDFQALRAGCVNLALKLDATVTELKALREEVSYVQETTKQFTTAHTSILLGIRGEISGLRGTVDGLPFRRGNTTPQPRRADELTHPPTPGEPVADTHVVGDSRFELVDL